MRFASSVRSDASATGRTYRGPIGCAPIEVAHLNCGTMCPIGRRFLLGEGGLLEKARIVAHCLLVEAGGELVLIDTGFGLGDCSEPNRLTLFFREGVRPELIERETAVRQLEALGHDPKDVRHI